MFAVISFYRNPPSLHPTFSLSFLFYSRTAAERKQRALQVSEMMFDKYTQ
ncbi:hypothetical protein HMPREF1986_01431 [Oribacterium sp. oral taxon 078 str. F0263]|nr:hypothetical protein HMPREF1986_01431 [Oribacterium sp. oral taxon 078 str. F0263]